MKELVKPFGFRFLTTVGLPTPAINLTGDTQNVADDQLDVATSYANTLTFTAAPGGGDNDFD